ncbi:hypothetical protein [Variovorax sp. DT-64]|uniref:hypothetical protein n=1 Tax=Variovorax sp. DT-64 TaxID=3396160 RepID=UPI003F1A480C
MLSESRRSVGLCSAAMAACSAANKAPWIGQTVLQPVNINWTAVTAPRNCAASVRAVPSWRRSGNLGAATAGTTGPTPTAARPVAGIPSKANAPAVSRRRRPGGAGRCRA